MLYGDEMINYINEILDEDDRILKDEIIKVINKPSNLKPSQQSDCCVCEMEKMAKNQDSEKNMVELS